MEEERITLMCPVCGELRTPLKKDTSFEFCDYCGEKTIRINSDPKKLSWTVCETVEENENNRKEIYIKFLFNTPKFDKILFNKRENRTVEDIIKDNKIKNEVKNINNLSCPKCGSTAITTGNRGFSIWTGFFGSGTTVNRCGNCGNKWKP